MKTAFITGVTGQDGSYLAELLLEKGYAVHGLHRWTSTNGNTHRIRHLIGKDRFKLHFHELRHDGGTLNRLLKVHQPDEFYNLAALSHVKVSFGSPIYTGEVTGLSSMQCLEALRGFSPHTRFYQASSSEMFGSSPPPQNELTPFHPRSPYGCAKAYSYHATINYREAYGMHASNGILFNHESPRRGPEFVTRKITQGLSRISKAVKAGREWEPIPLGNIRAARDWGHAKDYVLAMWMMLQADFPDDYVVATGEIYCVDDFLHEAFQHAELPGKVEDYYIIDPNLLRPSEVDALQGDSTKIRKNLGWAPCYDFPALVADMMAADMHS